MRVHEGLSPPQAVDWGDGGGKKGGGRGGGGVWWAGVAVISQRGSFRAFRVRKCWSYAVRGLRLQAELEAVKCNQKIGLELGLESRMES